MQQLAVLQNMDNTVQEENLNLRQDLAQHSTVSPNPSDHYDIKPQLSRSDTHSESYSVHRSKLKASDLPKYNGRDNEDIDQWIEKVTAISEFSNCQDSGLLQRLPMILQGKALTWFTQLGREKRNPLLTWAQWQLALRNAFYLPNHKSTLRRQCLYRTLKVKETFSDYFQNKQILQHYVHPPGSVDKELIDDMLEGKPQHFRPLIKASVNSLIILEDFHCTLIDLEPGLRSTNIRPHNGAIAPQISTYQPRTPQANNSSTKPPSPCPICKGDHWRRDCPHNQAKPAAKPFTKRTGSFPNNTYSDGHRWKPHQANNVTTKKSVHFDYILDEVEVLEQPPSKRREQPTTAAPLHELHQGKTPTYAACAINKTGGAYA